MIARMLWLACLVMVVSIVGCGNSEPKVTVTRVDHVKRVLMHETHWFTLITQEPESTELKMLTVVARGGVKIFSDVSEDNEMWAEITDSDDWNGDSLQLHIRSEKNIEGAGWNHGKHGSGTTQVLK